MIMTWGLILGAYVLLVFHVDFDVSQDEDVLI